MSIAAGFRSRLWQQDDHFISTDVSLLPLQTLHDAFASDTFYWANPLPDEVLQQTLQNSLCFGLYEGQHRQLADTSSRESLKLVGFARAVTDFTTFVYLTDVWVDPKQQGKGLGRWMVQCVQEIIEEMPYLRRSMLLTRSWEQSVPFYEKLMDMTVLGPRGQGFAVMERLGKGNPAYVEKKEQAE
jgi:ribosomal protein S18 acetylase RimI-like enzyme